VYLILSPFLDENELIKIFWENLLTKKKLLPIYKWLLWYNIKPFECVWTIKECKKAFKLTIRKYLSKQKKLPYILEKFKDII
jgi:hypothetical protein